MACRCFAFDEKLTEYSFDYFLYPQINWICVFQRCLLRGCASGGQIREGEISGHQMYRSMRITGERGIVGEWNSSSSKVMPRIRGNLINLMGYLSLGWKKKSNFHWRVWIVVWSLLIIVSCCIWWCQ